MTLMNFNKNIFLFLFSGVFLFYLLKLEILNIQISYFLTIFSLYLFLIFALLSKKIKIDTEFIIFLFYLINQSLLGYLLFGILDFNEGSRVFFVSLLVIGNCILYLIFSGYIPLYKFINALFVLGSIYLLYSSFLFIKTFSEFGSFFRFTSNFQDPNYFTLLLILIMTVLMIKLRQNSGLLAVIIYTLIMLDVFLIIMTFSRTGYISLIGFFVTLLVYEKRHIITLKNVLKFCCLIFLILFFVNYLGWDNFISFIEWRFFSESERTGGISRFYEIKAGINLFLTEFPKTLLGTGIASTEVTDFFAKYYTDDIGIQPRIHNTYISIFVENGPFGLFMFLYLLRRSLLYIKYYGADYKAYYMALYVSCLISSMFVWNLYYLPFFIGVFYLPFMLKNKALTN